MGSVRGQSPKVASGDDPATMSYENDVRLTLGAFRVRGRPLRAPSRNISSATLSIASGPPARDIDSSGGIRTAACSGGFRHWDFSFSVPVFVTGTWHFPALGFAFSNAPLLLFRTRRSGRALGPLGFIHSLELAPVVRRPLAFRVSKRETEQVRCAVSGIASNTVLGYDEEPECDRLTDGRADRVTMDAIADEIIICDRQPSVLFPAVVGMFDVNAIEHPAR